MYLRFMKSVKPDKFLRKKEFQSHDNKYHLHEQHKNRQRAPQIAQPARHGVPAQCGQKGEAYTGTVPD